MNTNNMTQFKFVPDLTNSAPRSLRCRLGGYVILPRMLDKCRAFLQGLNGDYHYNCPLDQEFLRFVGIDAEVLKEELSQGRSDDEMIIWVQANAINQRSPWEVLQWSEYQLGRMPESNSDLFEYFTTTLASLSQTRGDVHTWADLLDLDDYRSFVGAD